jgi:hypothetical protein
MPLILKDRVLETTTTTGTGTITLAGAVSGFQSFSVVGNANTTYYAIVGGTEWEVGIGTYTSSGTTLSRDTILESSTGGTAVNFSAGSKNVFVTYPAEKSVDLDTAQSLSNKTLVDPAITGTIKEDVFTITDAAGFAIDPTNGSIQLITLGANRTPTQANWDAGEAVTLMVNDGTAFTITWSTIGVVWVGGAAPTLATTGFTVIELWKVSTTVYGATVGAVA